MADDLRKIVEESFRMMGCEQVKPEQWTAIKAFVSGVDVFVALPTGFGKSLIYATLPPIYDNLKNWKKSIVVVVSPLLAFNERPGRRVLIKRKSCCCCFFRY